MYDENFLDEVAKVKSEVKAEIDADNRRIAELKAKGEYNLSNEEFLELLELENQDKLNENSFDALKEGISNLHKGVEENIKKQEKLVQEAKAQSEKAQKKYDAQYKSPVASIVAKAQPKSIVKQSPNPVVKPTLVTPAPKISLLNLHHK